MWKNPTTLKTGQYQYYEDSNGRPLGAEGWLSTTPAARDERAQREVAGSLPGFDAAHLIPASLGGLGSAKNLVPMPAVMNRSYVRAVENLVTRHLHRSPVFLRVSVVYKGPGALPVEITHRAFLKSSDGLLVPMPSGEITTMISQNPKVPMGRVVPPRNFLSADPYVGVANKLPI